ncbi:SH3 domain-containing protein [Stenotrophomonas sp. ATCM1_4]|uniref:SH3 domain-containing protein n=1 Tax=Stenotrophomonas sp. ATCM1_4 TaxID=2259330 RepID=UPI0031B68121
MAWTPEPRGPDQCRCNLQETHMEARQCRVIRGHTSEYPNPISFTKGALLVVGERHEGPEGWDNWLLCDTQGQKGGWVPLANLSEGRQ